MSHPWVHGPESAAEFDGLMGFLWSEVRKLLPDQRTALLSHLPAPMAMMLSVYAPPDELAKSLGCEVTRLDEAINRLPIPDKRTAERLGITPQQVINLRMVARRRLARRVLAYESGKKIRP
jgi:hypothetical protein